MPAHDPDQFTRAELDAIAVLDKRMRPGTMWMTDDGPLYLTPGIGHRDYRIPGTEVEDFYPTIMFETHTKTMLVGFRHPTTGEQHQCRMDMPALLDYVSRLIDSARFVARAR